MVVESVRVGTYLKEVFFNKGVSQKVTCKTQIFKAFFIYQHIGINSLPFPGATFHYVMHEQKIRPMGPRDQVLKTTKTPVKRNHFPYFVDYFRYFIALMQS
jgi:hypothetical protein